ncbi:protein Abitram-like isoform X1 [Oratosquilla oratoria]|uniref:protein Abitram-like isoform X1 n=1 Tax=Oratosquilla oratoria TaxID=337810 RepID=UPI003F7666D0
MGIQDIPIEKSVELTINYPRVSDRYFTKYYAVPKAKINQEGKEGENCLVKEEKTNNPDEKASSSEGERTSKSTDQEIQSSKSCVYSENRAADVCIMMHSNRLCVVTVSHLHPIIADGKIVTKVNFDVGEVNRLNNKVSGKAKKGAQPIRHFSPLCILTCSDGSEYKIKAGIRGKLVEVNEELLTNPQLVNEKPDAEGFLAVVLPNLVESDNLKKLLLSESQYLNIRESGSGGGEM